MAYVRQPPPSIEVMLDQFDHNGGNMSSARKRAALQKANNEAEFLRQRLMRAEHQVDKVTAMAFATAQKYDQLLLAVGRKFRDESRHETALRYIREAEATAEVGSGCTAAMGSNDRVEGRDAASSRRVPSHDGLCGNGNYNERTEK